MPKRINICPPQEYLLECFDYVDGELIWKERPICHFKRLMTWKSWNKKFVGKVAGYIIHTKNGSRHRIILNDILYERSLIVWVLHGKEHPQNKEELDHHDRNSCNDKIENLRLCDRSQNNRNTKTRKHNKLGVKGVRQSNSKYSARIRVNKKEIHLGTFKTVTEAYQAYCEAGRKYHGEFFNPGEINENS